MLVGLQGCNLVAGVDATNFGRALAMFARHCEKRRSVGGDDKGVDSFFGLKESLFLGIDGISQSSSD